LEFKKTRLQHNYRISEAILLQSVVGTPVMNHLDELEAQSISILRASDPSAVNPGTGRVAIEGLDGRIVGGGLIRALIDGRAAPASATTARKTRIPTKRGIATEALRAELEAKAALLGSLIKDLSPTNRLRKLREEIAGRIVFTTSFGLEAPQGDGTWP
jgi:hypothetical protein